MLKDVKRLVRVKMVPTQELLTLLFWIGLGVSLTCLTTCLVVCREPLAAGCQRLNTELQNLGKPRAQVEESTNLVESNQ